jgi:hypothetical protein
MLYTKKPIPVQAYDLLIDEGKKLTDGIDENGKYFINTLEGRHTARDDDFVIVGIRGEKYFIKRDIFFETYIPAN